jgi:hypothetical protein
MFCKAPFDHSVTEQWNPQGDENDEDNQTAPEEGLIL